MFYTDESAVCNSQGVTSLCSRADWYAHQYAGEEILSLPILGWLDPDLDTRGVRPFPRQPLHYYESTSLYIHGGRGVEF